MKRTYDDEAFLPWYRRPSPTWLELSASARGTLVSVSMELSPKHGEITLRRGLASLAVLVRIPWDILEPALAELIAAGKLAWDGSRFVLSDPEYLDRARPTSKERVAKHRAGKVDAIREEDQTRREEKRREVTLPTDTHTPVTDVTLRALHEPPAWFETVLDVLAANVDPERLPSAEAWLRYDGHRATKGIEPTAKDAQYWLTSVMIAERRKAREDARHRADRDKQFDDKRRFAKDGPEKPPPPTREQSQSFARELAARVTAGRKVGT